MVPDKIVMREVLGRDFFVKVGHYVRFNDVLYRCVSAHVDGDDGVTEYTRAPEKD